MVQTNLKSDNFCDYNQSAGPFHWIMDPTQVNVQYNVGEVGLPTGVGLHTPAQVIKVSNFLSDRGNYLTSCVPPVPNMLSKYGNKSDTSINNNGPPLETQGLDLPTSPHTQEEKFTDRAPLKLPEHFTDTGNDNQKKYSGKISNADGSTTYHKHKTTDFLLPSVQNNKASAINLAHIDLQGGFSGNVGNLFTEPQNLTYVIERMWLQRGGLDQNQEIKKAYEYGGPKNLNICNKIRKPYDIKYPFGLPTTDNGKPIYVNQTPSLQSHHFTPNDVVALGSSSPVYQQNMLDKELEFRVAPPPYNYNANYTNGGCNNISVIKDDKMCSNYNNDLTGINDFNFGKDVTPPGVVKTY